MVPPPINLQTDFVLAFITSQGKSKTTDGGRGVLKPNVWAPDEGVNHKQSLTSLEL